MFHSLHCTNWRLLRKILLGSWPVIFAEELEELSTVIQLEKIHIIFCQQSGCPLCEIQLFYHIWSCIQRHDSLPCCVAFFFYKHPPIILNFGMFWEHCLTVYHYQDCPIFMLYTSCILSWLITLLILLLMLTWNEILATLSSLYAGWTGFNRLCIWGEKSNCCWAIHQFYSTIS